MIPENKTQQISSKLYNKVPARGERGGKNQSETCIVYNSLPSKWWNETKLNDKGSLDPGSAPPLSTRLQQFGGLHLRMLRIPNWSVFAGKLASFEGVCYTNDDI